MYLLNKKQNNQTKLIRRGVAIKTDTEFLLHVTTSTDAWSTSKFIAGNYNVGAFRVPQIVSNGKFGHQYLQR